jgi:transcriptional regulator
MFVPRHFAEDRVDVLVELARTAGFGHLVVADSNEIASTPMPFVIADDASRVHAHLARPNGLWKLTPCPALLVVPVDDTYISPSWYPSKAQHGKVVPTWNYEVVHLHGRLVAHDDAEWISAQVRELTDFHESAMPTPWSVDDAPLEYIDKMIRGIVGIELVVDRIEGKRKLSQNKTADELAGAIEGLAGSPHRGAAEIRAAMDLND